MSLCPWQWSDPMEYPSSAHGQWEPLLCCQSQHVLPGGLGSLGLAGRQQQWPVWWEQEHYTRNGREKRLVVFLSVGEGVGQAVAPRNVTISLSGSSGTQAAATSASRVGCLLEASLLSYVPLMAIWYP